MAGNKTKRNKVKPQWLHEQLQYGSITMGINLDTGDIIIMEDYNAERND